MIEKMAAFKVSGRMAIRAVRRSALETAGISWMAERSTMMKGTADRTMKKEAWAA